MLEGSSEACHRRARWWRRSAHLRLAAPVNPAMRACDGQSWWPTWLRSWDLGVGVRSGRLDRRNCEDWLSCRRTSRCSGRSRRRDIGVTSTNRSCGGLAAERQTVRRTWHLGWRSDLERWQMPCEGALGNPDLGVAFWAGRSGKWAVTPDARNTRTAIAVYRGPDSLLESRRTSR